MLPGDTSKHPQNPSCVLHALHTFFNFEKARNPDSLAQGVLPIFLQELGGKSTEKSDLSAKDMSEAELAQDDACKAS